MLPEFVNCAVMVALPTFTPVTMPLLLTVATVVLEEVQVTAEPEALVVRQIFM